MKDYIHIGSVPIDEFCVSVSKEHDYWPALRIAQLAKSPEEAKALAERGLAAKAEVAIFKRQLERTFPEGTFTVKVQLHDFGQYTEVVAWFDVDAGEGNVEMKAAFDAESKTPTNWDAEAQVEIQALHEKYPAELWSSS